MKHSNFLFPLLVFSLLTGALTKLLSRFGQDLFYLSICQNDIPDFPLNYRGSSLTSHFDDDSPNLVLCPGDTFGDLNGTYVTLHNCYFAIYHEGKEIGSFGRTNHEEIGVCAGSLEKDGNLVLYKQIDTNAFQDDNIRYLISPRWNSGTDYNPNKIELRTQNQQFQIVHIFEDGSQRIFYTGENITEFREDLGAPKQLAEKFLLIDHSDTDNVILRRNEYIGDLNGMHLILQTNCELELKNLNRVIWSFAVYLKPDERCTLNAYSTSIWIPTFKTNHTTYYGMSLFPSYRDFKVLQSQITFQQDQLLIIQTLENGSEVTFHSEPGQDIGLKLKKEPRQIAKNKITIFSKVILERMDYIGDLDGLHLILQNDCVFMLANGDQELWKLKESLDRPSMECNVLLNEDGKIWLNHHKNKRAQETQVQIFGKIKKWNEIVDSPSLFKLSLENNMIVLSLKYKYSGNIVNTFHAGVKTNGTWFQHLSGHSLFVNANDKTDKIFPELGYIGDIDGVYAVLNKKGNLILYNETRMIWESGTAQEEESGFVLMLTRDGNVAVSEKQSGKTLWSSETASYYKDSKLKESELFVNNDGFWLNNIYVNGVVKRFKAQEGTNTFVLLPDEEDEFRRSSF